MGTSDVQSVSFGSVMSGVLFCMQALLVYFHIVSITNNVSSNVLLSRGALLRRGVLYTIVFTERSFAQGVLLGRGGQTGKYGMYWLNTSLQTILLSINQSYLSIHLSAYLSISTSIYLFTSINILLYLTVNLSILTLQLVHPL